MVEFVYDLFFVLTAGAVGGIACKRLGFSMPVGYLLAGAVIGRGGLGLIAGNVEEIEHLAHVGALLLLFAIGIEFSLEELARLSRYFFVGGSVQMTLVAVPVALVCLVLGVSWQATLLIAAATAFSSTVLVFRALAEWGETASPQGRRAIGVLLFQDVALVPVLLLVPLLVGDEKGPQTLAYVLLALNSILFVSAVLLVRMAVAKWIVPLLGKLRSIELATLFALIILVGFCLGAVEAGLPAAVGAFAAGLALSGNRLTGQLDALILPYRESFGAVFFVSLGTLLDPSIILEEPFLLAGTLLAVLVVKTGAAAVALWASGLRWRAALGMGLGLAQLGELSLMILSEGLHAGLIRPEAYNRVLSLAVGTLILTPPLLKLGLGWAQEAAPDEQNHGARHPRLDRMPAEAVVVGIGPIGRQATSRLEIMGIDVCLIDLSPANLYFFTQQGFRAVAGDARDEEVLRRAHADHARLAIIAVPDDGVALQIVQTLRSLNPTCVSIVRCRYESQTPVLKKAGASRVVSEEAEVSVAVLRLLEDTVP